MRPGPSGRNLLAAAAAAVTTRQPQLLPMLLAAALGVGGGIGCSASAPSPPPPSEPEGVLGRIYDVAADTFLSEQDLAARLVGSRYVLLGEHHDNSHHHVLQARVIDLLLASGVRPVIAMEMLTTDRSGAILDCQAEPRCSVDEFRHAIEWDASGWPAWELYAPIFHTAIAARLPIVAADIPPNAMRVIASSSAEHADVRAQWIDALRLDRGFSGSERRELEAEIRDAHCGFLPDAAVPTMVRAQRARDAHLAMSTERAGVDRGAVVVLIAGAAHIRTDRGVPAYFTDPRARNVTLSIGFVEADPLLKSPREYTRFFDGDLPFDVVWFTEAVEREDPCETHRERLQAIGP